MIKNRQIYGYIRLRVTMYEQPTSSLELIQGKEKMFVIAIT